MWSWACCKKYSQAPLSPILKSRHSFLNLHPLKKIAIFCGQYSDLRLSVDLTRGKLVTAGPDQLLLGIRDRKEFYESKVKHNCKHKPGNTVVVGWKFNGKEMVIFPAIFLVEYNCNIGHNAPNGFSTWKNGEDYYVFTKHQRYYGCM